MANLEAMKVKLAGAKDNTVYGFHLPCTILPAMKGAETLCDTRFILAKKGESIFKKRKEKNYDKIKQSCIIKVKGYELDYTRAKEWSASRKARYENPIQISSDRMYPLLSKEQLDEAYSAMSEKEWLELVYLSFGSIHYAPFARKNNKHNLNKKRKNRVSEKSIKPRVKDVVFKQNTLKPAPKEKVVEPEKEEAKVTIHQGVINKVGEHIGNSMKPLKGVAKALSDGVDAIIPNSDVDALERAKKRLKTPPTSTKVKPNKVHKGAKKKPWGKKAKTERSVEVELPKTKELILHYHGSRGEIIDKDSLVASITRASGRAAVEKDNNPHPTIKGVKVKAPNPKRKGKIKVGDRELTITPKKAKKTVRRVNVQPEKNSNKYAYLASLPWKEQQAYFANLEKEHERRKLSPKKDSSIKVTLKSQYREALAHNKAIDKENHEDNLCVKTKYPHKGKSRELLHSTNYSNQYRKLNGGLSVKILTEEQRDKFIIYSGLNNKREIVIKEEEKLENGKYRIKYYHRRNRNYKGAKRDRKSMNYWTPIEHPKPKGKNASKPSLLVCIKIEDKYFRVSRANAAEYQLTKKVEFVSKSEWRKAKAEGKTPPESILRPQEDAETKVKRYEERMENLRYEDSRKHEIHKNIMKRKREKRTDVSYRSANKNLIKGEHMRASSSDTALCKRLTKLICHFRLRWEHHERLITNLSKVRKELNVDHLDLQNSVKKLSKSCNQERVFNQGVLTPDNYKKRVIKDYVLHSNGKKQYPADKRPSIDTMTEIIRELGFKPKATKAKNRIKELAKIGKDLVKKLLKDQPDGDFVEIKPKGKVAEKKADIPRPKRQKSPKRKTKASKVEA